MKSARFATSAKVAVTHPEALATAAFASSAG